MIFVMLLLMGLVANVYGQTPTIKTVPIIWDVPTVNVDGSPATDLAGYRVYMRSSPIPDSGDKAALIAELSATVTETTVDVTTDSNAYFRVSAFDTSMNESALSNELMVDFVSPIAVIIRFKLP